MSNQHLIQLAQKQQPNQPDLSACWDLVVRGLEVSWLDSDDLNELLANLERGDDYMVEELGLEFIGDRLRVSFLDEIYSCSPQDMIAQLQKLRQETISNG